MMVPTTAMHTTSSNNSQTRNTIERVLHGDLIRAVLVFVERRTELLALGRASRQFTVEVLQRRERWPVHVYSLPSVFIGPNYAVRGTTETAMHDSHWHDAKEICFSEGRPIANMACLTPLTRIESVSYQYFSSAAAGGMQPSIDTFIELHAPRITRFKVDGISSPPQLLRLLVPFAGASLMDIRLGLRSDRLLRDFVAIFNCEVVPHLRSLIVKMSSPSDSPQHPNSYYSAIRDEWKARFVDATMTDSSTRFLQPPTLRFIVEYEGFRRWKKKVSEFLTWIPPYEMECLNFDARLDWPRHGEVSDTDMASIPWSIAWLRKQQISSLKVEVVCDVRITYDAPGGWHPVVHLSPVASDNPTSTASWDAILRQAREITLMCVSYDPRSSNSSVADAAKENLESTDATASRSLSDLLAASGFFSSYLSRIYLCCRDFPIQLWADTILQDIMQTAAAARATKKTASQSHGQPQHLPTPLSRLPIEFLVSIGGEPSMLGLKSSYHKWSLDFDRLTSTILQWEQADPVPWGEQTAVEWTTDMASKCRADDPTIPPTLT